MSVHEVDVTLSSHTIYEGSGSPGADIRVAQAAIEAFKLALKELGEPVPENGYRVILSVEGLELEVRQGPTTTVTNYGTPAPVEEIATFLDEGHPDDLDSIVLPADGVAFTAEELDALRVGYRVYDHTGDRWQKRAAGDWVFVSSLGRESSALTMAAEELADVWGPLTREAPE